jgi:hypothetical protein
VRFKIRLLYSQEGAPFIHKIGGWVDSRDAPNVVTMTEIPVRKFKSFYTKLTLNVTDNNSKSTILHPPIYA